MYPVDMRKLRTDLCGSDKLPSGFQGVFEDFIVFLQTFSRDRELVRTTVCVTPSRGGARHRVFLACPTCGDFVPAGRVAQHHRKHDLAIVEGLREKAVFDESPSLADYMRRVADRLHKMHGGLPMLRPTPTKIVHALRRYGLFSYPFERKNVGGNSPEVSRT